MQHRSENGDRMRIAMVRAKQFKCIVEIEIEPSGDIITIAGDTGQGKTSILEAIETTLRGGDETFVQRGADHCELFVQVGNLAVSRSIDTEGKEKLGVTRGGLPMKARDAKALLDALFGVHVFRPIEWVLLSGGDAKGRKERLRRQRDELLHAMPLRLGAEELADAVDALGPAALQALSQITLELDLQQQHGLVACEVLYTSCYSARTVANKQASEAEAALRALPVPPTKIPPESLEQLAKQERDADHAWQRALGAQTSQAATRTRAEHLREIVETDRQSLATSTPIDEAPLVAKGQAIAQKIADMQRQIQLLEADREDLRQELIRTRAFNDEIRRRRTRAEQNAAELVELEGALGQVAEDPAALQRDLERIRDRKDARRLSDAHGAAAAKLAELGAWARALDLLVDLFRQTLPAQLLERAKFPIPGLGLDGEQLTIDGVPIQRLGTSEQIRLGVRVAVALNPSAGFVCVDGAESLGVDGRRELALAAAEHGIQLFLTEVDTDPAPGSIVMVDGEAVST